MTDREFVKSLLRQMPVKNSQTKDRIQTMQPGPLKVLAVTMYESEDNYGPEVYRSLAATHFISADDYFNLFKELQQEVDHEELGKLMVEIVKKNYPPTE